MNKKIELNKSVLLLSKQIEKAKETKKQGYKKIWTKTMRIIKSGILLTV